MTRQPEIEVVRPRIRMGLRAKPDMLPNRTPQPARRQIGLAPRFARGLWIGRSAAPASPSNLDPTNGLRAIWRLKPWQSQPERTPRVHTCPELPNTASDGGVLVARGKLKEFVPSVTAAIVTTVITLIYPSG